MKAESPTSMNGEQKALDSFRRLCFAHVGTVVLTAALAVPLLFRIASLPSWLSVAYCVVIATAAITFVVTALRWVRENRELCVADRIQCLALTLGLSMIQAIFILPIAICVFAPDFRA